MSQERIKSSTVFLVLAVLAIFFVMVQVGAFLLFHMLNKPRHVHAEASLKKPDAPLLEESVSQDVDQLRKKDREILNSYGWVDRSRHIIRVPVAKAMELMLSKSKDTP